MREWVVQGELVEEKGSATKGVLANKLVVLRGNTLQWQEKQGQEQLLCRELHLFLL